VGVDRAFAVDDVRGQRVLGGSWKTGKGLDCNKDVYKPCTMRRQC
jgi:hypothetical protein